MHFNSPENPNKKDKYHKLRPPMKHLQEKFFEHFIPEKMLSQYETMVKYFGKHSWKECIRSKPIHFGHKIWCQNKVLGYLIAFDPYQGNPHIPILEELKKRGYEGTGTIRSNRIDKKCQISSPKLFVNAERGYSECATGTRKYFRMKISRGKDNAIVTVASFVFDQHSTSKVKRWLKQQKVFIEIDVTSGI
ncbi:piggyBac transposable element-derived protein 3-like [Lepeophtheirus salmonis]|uniref:piggyBac transposable element-derived protein 3-like n=1 Tax=Lepeophtheirus salmonis TaxID=72036 RepID=UPI003AF37EB9